MRHNTAPEPSSRPLAFHLWVLAAFLLALRAFGADTTTHDMGSGIKVPIRSIPLTGPIPGKDAKGYANALEAYGKEVRGVADDNLQALADADREVSRQWQEMKKMPEDTQKEKDDKAKRKEEIEAAEKEIARWREWNQSAFDRAREAMMNAEQIRSAITKDTTGSGTPTALSSDPAKTGPPLVNGAHDFSGPNVRSATNPNGYYTPLAGADGYYTTPDGRLVFNTRAGDRLVAASTPNTSYAAAFGNGTAGTPAVMNGLQVYNPATGQYATWSSGGNVAGTSWQHSFRNGDGTSMVWDNGGGTGGTGTPTVGNYTSSAYPAFASTNGSGFTGTGGFGSTTSTFSGWATNGTGATPMTYTSSAHMTGTQALATPYSSWSTAANQATINFGTNWAQSYEIYSPTSGSGAGSYRLRAKSGGSVPEPSGRPFWAGQVLNQVNWRPF